MPCVPCPGDASAKAAGSPVDALECFLRWRHLAPTAPDTLGTVMRTGFPERLVDGPAGGSRGSCDLRATVCFFQQRATRFMTPIPSSSRTHPTCFLLGTKNRTRRDCALVGCHDGRESFLQVIGDARIPGITLALFGLLLAVNDSAVRLISVPRFSTTGTAVLVNLQTLECEPITFSGELLTAEMQ